MKAPSKCHFFTWLLLLGRCWTSQHLQRHDLQNSMPCALCSQCDEHIDHLAVSCVYNRQVWFSVLNRTRWQQITPTAHDSFAD
jgi:hypothetical protein